MGDGWQAARLNELLARRGDSGHHYAEFMRGEFASAGLATWPAGATDTQRPHAEDEVYYCVAGRAKLAVGGDVVNIAPGTAVYVARGVQHRFFEIEDEIQLIVFWAPPHRSLEAPASATDVGSDA